MGWSPESAANAYRETVELCKLGTKNNYTSADAERHSTEFLAALAAGIMANLIVEVSAYASSSTVALAVAARKTGGRLICILSKSEALLDAMVAMNALGLSRVVEFLVGDASDILPQFSDIDFALIDCMREHSVEQFNLLRLNPIRAIVVAKNLFQREARASYENIMTNRTESKSVILPIGEGIEVTRLSRKDEINAESDIGKGQQGRRQVTKRVRWAMDVDDISMPDVFHY